MKNHFLTLLLLLYAGIARAATSYAIAAWGDNDVGQASVPVAAQSGVTAIAVGVKHTVALTGR